MLRMGDTGKIWVVGVGPGNPEYLTKKATFVVKRADVVAGWEHALKIVDELAKGERVQFTSHQTEENVIAYLAREARKGKKCVVCTVGDPNFSDNQLLEKIRKFGEIEIVPGISSVQIAASQAKVPFEKSRFITFHKSGPINNEKEKLLRAVKEGRRNVIVLPRPWDFMPRDIAKFLIDNGVVKNLEVTVHENLTLSDERVHVCKLSDLLNTEHGDLSIIIIKKRGA